MRNKDVKITGMTCAACAASIERAVKKMPGVEVANINLVAEEMKLSYDEEKFLLKIFKRKLKNLDMVLLIKQSQRLQVVQMVELKHTELRE